MHSYMLPTIDDGSRSFENNDAAEVFDWFDDMELKSSMTLFEKAILE